MGRKTNICAVAVCSSPQDASFHRFPKEPKRRALWLKACKRLDPVNPDTGNCFLWITELQILLVAACTLKIDVVALVFFWQFEGCVRELVVFDLTKTLLPNWKAAKSAFKHSMFPGILGGRPSRVRYSAPLSEWTANKDNEIEPKKRKKSYQAFDTLC